LIGKYDDHSMEVDTAFQRRQLWVNSLAGTNLLL